jgi:hypothetical protein
MAIAHIITPSNFRVLVNFNGYRWTVLQLDMEDHDDTGDEVAVTEMTFAGENAKQRAFAWAHSIN